jgi:polyisoprenyl-phosphate glycosyltransferase
MKLLSIVIPVFRNEGSLPPLFGRLLAVEQKLEALDFGLELIFVDDGSDDNSLAELLNIKRERPATIVVKLTRNFGENKASRCGLRFVTGNCFSILAADLQDPPELIVEMAQRWGSGSKFIVCERISRDDPALSKFYSALYYRLLRLLVMPDYPVGGYDLALMDAAFLPHLTHTSKNLVTPLLAFWLGYKPDVITYHRERRVHGRSAWTFAKRLSAFLDVMLGFSMTPIRLISGIGIVVSALSFAYGLAVVFAGLFTQVDVAGWTTIVALMSFLLGLVIAMLGLIGEYLWRIFY